MTEPTFPAADPAWAKAFTLAERVARARPSAPGGGDRARAERRLARWRRAHDLADGDGYAAMLRTVPDAEAGLLDLLAEPAGDLAGRIGGPPPAWWSRIHEAADAASAPAEGAGPVADWRHAFAVILAPVAHQALRELAARIRADEQVSAGLAVRPVLTSFLGGLNGLLVSAAARTLILELNVLRELGRLEGATSDERFASFVEQFTKPGAQHAFYSEYPVLARMLVQRAASATEATWELVRRWTADRELIRDELLGGVDPGLLTAIGGGAGDPHRGGRSVAFLTFADGRQVVYKPRPQAVHERFNALLRWLDDRVGLDLRTLTVLDRGEYGWLEYAEYVPCETSEQVTGYYRRLGAQMALLHAVNGTDFHFENLIACGDQPVLVDLEALFHQPSPTVPGSLADLDPAVRELGRSVVRIGLLPMLVATEQGAIDIGGLGGDPRAVSPFASASWSGEGTDVMRVVREHLPFPGAQNRPSAEEGETDLAAHIPTVLDGFRLAYRAIEADREALVAPGGVVDSFADAEVRIVLRPTQTYATLIQEGTHPDLLRDALDRDRHLAFLWAASAGFPGMESVVPAELADLWAGDVPLFTARPGSRDLETSRGTRLTDFYAESGLARVRAKLAAFGERDLALQEWAVRASLQTRNVAFSSGAVPIASRTRIVERVAPAGAAVRSVDLALETATAIAGHLVTSASSDAERVSWLGLEMADDKAWRVSPIGWDLYSGAAGIALFLDAAGEVAGRSDFRECARRALWQVPAVVERLEALSADGLAGQASLHGFGGLPGLAYALVHLRADSGLIERVVRLSGHLLGNGAELDVVSGAAGTAACMLAVHAATGLGASLELARRNGELLRAAAEPAGEGLAWPTIEGSARPMVGFAHGAGGIAWALVRLGVAVGDERFASAGLAGFAYERGQYRAEWGNWPDFRPTAPKGAPHMHAWCHGAPGIGLARADVVPLVGDVGLADDLELAVASTVAEGFGRNHSLCHGDLGNLELLVVAGRQGGDGGGRGDGFGSGNDVGVGVGVDVGAGAGAGAGVGVARSVLASIAQAGPAVRHAGEDRDARADDRAGRGGARPAAAACAGCGAFGAVDASAGVRAAALDRDFHCDAEGREPGSPLGR